MNYYYSGIPPPLKWIINYFSRTKLEQIGVNSIFSAPVAQCYTSDTEGEDGGSSPTNGVFIIF